MFFGKPNLMTCNSSAECVQIQERLAKGLEDQKVLQNTLSNTRESIASQGARIGVLEGAINTLLSQNLDKRVYKNETDIEGIVKGFEKVQEVLSTVADKVTLQQIHSVKPKEIVEHITRISIAVLQAGIIAIVLKYALEVKG